MKVAQTKPATTATKKSTPFFNKEAAQDFFNPGTKKNDAFFKARNVSPVQTKLNVGNAGDHYEKEADAMADKVVQRLSEPAGIQKKPTTPVSSITPLIQNKCASCDKEEKLQKKDKEEDKDLSKNKLQKKPIFESNAVPPPPPPNENTEDKNSLITSVQKKSIFESKDITAEKNKVQQEAAVVNRFLSTSLQKKSNFDSDVSPPGRSIHIQSKSDGSEKGERLQKKEKEDEKDLVKDKLQKKPIFESNAAPPDDEKNVQRKCDECAKEEELQKKNDAGHESTASSKIESSLHSSKGSGSPLPQNTRQQMESSFGSDFSNVRIHSDSSAEEMSKDLNAQAFTHGNDIYFNSGKYDTNSTAGKHLLAHELTHTIQQAGRVQKMLQRQKGDNDPDPTSEPFNPSGKEIKLKRVSLPRLKERNKKFISKPLTRPKNYQRDDSFVNAQDSKKKPQANLWRSTVKKAIEPILDTKLTEIDKKGGLEGDTYYMEWQDKQEKLYLFGTKKVILDGCLIPTWSKKGKAYAYDVDHIQELQLGGKNNEQNLELLSFSSNRASGSKIADEIDNRVGKFILSGTKNPDTKNLDKWPKDIDSAKSKYSIVFADYDFGLGKIKDSDDDYWSIDEISKGEQLKKFVPMGKEARKKITGSKEDPVIYTSEAGGKPLHQSDLKKMKGLDMSVTINDEVKDKTVGTLNIDVSPKNKILGEQHLKLPVYKKSGVIYGGYIPRGASEAGDGLEQVLSQLQIRGLSPVSIDFADILPNVGIIARGQIHPTLEIIKGFDLDFYIEGDDFGISKTITAEQIKVPPPFKINSASLTLFAGTNGFGVKGDVLFEISKVGTGKISGTGKADGKFGISGSFDFDKKLFSGGASISVEYDSDNLWKIHGELGIKKGTVKGIQSGKITVDYEQGKLKADGTAIPEIKAVQEVTLKIELSKDQFMVEGGIKLNKLPGIKSGEGTLAIVKKDEDYDFSGKGKILPDVPGIESEVDFTVNNGLFNVDVNVNYDHNRLSGSLHLGITNEGVGSDGKPDNKISDNISFYGGGTLGLMITENLKATAGVNIKRDGNIELMGKIELPKSFQLFPSPLPKIEKDLLPIPAIHIPIFAIPLGVANIGLEATIAPHLKAEAEIGPGLLTNVFAEIDYDTANPDAMTITGGADFEMRAYAMIKVGVDLDLGLSIGVASISGGIGLNAGVILEAKQPLLHTELKWSPKSGFDFQGLAQVVLSPKLFFSVDAHVKAHVVLAGDYTLIDKQLANKEFDPGLDFGMKLPFHYQQGKPFNLSFSDIQFVYPKFDSQTLTKLKDSVVVPLKQEFLN